MRSNDSGRMLRAALGFAAALLGLRLYTLLCAVGEDGLLPRGSWVLPLTVLLSAACFVTLGLLGLRLNRLPGADRCFVGGAWESCGIFAGLLLFAGSLISLLQTAELGSLNALLQTRAYAEFALRLSHVLGMASGASMIAVILLRRNGKNSYWPQALMSFFMLLSMVLRFRDWSHEPLVIEIVPQLLALICSMVCVMLISGFALGVGHRRSSVSFGLCAGIFTLTALPDFLLRGLSAGDLLICLGLGLWCAVHALRLLQPDVQNETAPEAADEAPAPEADAAEPPEAPAVDAGQSEEEAPQAYSDPE